MADIESNIGINIDASGALATLKELQRQISVFQTTMSKTGAISSGKLQDLQQNLINNINATGQFTASIQRVKTTTESFTQALEKNKLSMGQYFRYAIGSTQTFGRAFRTEFDTIDKVARERVKTLQTQYIKLGRDATGAMQAIAVRPQVLDMKDLGTQTAIAAQKAQLFNQLMQQGSTNLLNFGKNTQWAGRQLMVGFTIPLGIMGAAAAREFQKIEEQVLRLERVYGDFTTTVADTEAATEQIKGLANEFTKYGIAVEKTIGLAADAAAMGQTGAALMAQVSEATRLATLGGVTQQQSLETTISLTSAFGVAAEDLAKKTDFLNAVENQTVTSIADLTEAIPKAGPVIQQLGGNVEDLTFFLTAMREGGINASESANALKSGLASLINPTQEASDMLAGFGINLQGIVAANQGNVRGIVVDFARALDTLDPLNRAQAIEQLFGKFQFSRLSTLFQNVIAEGTQASRVLELTNASAAELAALSERELGKIESSPLFQYQGAIERFKASLAPVGEEFMKAVTPLINFGTQLLDAFNGWSDGAKQFAVVVTAAVAGIGPIFLMTFGLMANGLANIVKGVMFVRNGFKGLGGQSNILTDQLNYMNTEQLESAAISASLNQVHNNLIQTFTSEAGAVRNLAAAYAQGISAQSAFMGGTMAGGRRPRKMASGGLVPGSGNGDTVPAMLTPGEFVLTKEVANRYPGLIAAMMSGKIPGFSRGGRAKKGGGRVEQMHMAGGLDISLPNIAEQVERLAPGLLGVMNQYEELGQSVEVLSDLVAEKSETLNQRARAMGMNADEFEAEWGKDSGGFIGTAERAAAAEGKQLTTAEVRDLELFDKELGGRISKRIRESAPADMQRAGWLDDLIAEETGNMIDEGLQSDDRVRQGVAKKLKSRKDTVATIRTKSVQNQIDPATGKPYGSAANYYNRMQERGILKERPGKVGLYAEGSDFQFARPYYQGTAEQKAQQRLQVQQAKASGRSPGVNYRTNSLTAGAFAPLIPGGTYEKPMVKPEQVARARRAGRQAFDTQLNAFTDSLASTAATASPSRRTRKIAKDTVDGYANELESGKRRVAQAARETVNAQVNATRGGGRGAGSRVAGFFGFGGEGDASSKVGRAAGRLGGLTMTAGGIAGMMSMMGGPVGEAAGAAMGPLLIGGGIMEVLSLFTKMPPQLALVLAGVAAVTAGFVLLAKVQADEAKKRQEVTDALGNVAKKTEEVAAKMGVITASTEAEKAQTGVVESVSAASQALQGTTQGQEFLKGEPGKQIEKDARTLIKEFGVKEAANEIAEQLSYAIIQGVISPEQADSIAKALGQQLENKEFAIKVRAELTDIFGQNAKMFENAPAEVIFGIQEREIKDQAKQWTKAGGELLEAYAAAQRSQEQIYQLELEGRMEEADQLRASNARLWQTYEEISQNAKYEFDANLAQRAIELGMEQFAVNEQYLDAIKKQYAQKIAQATTEEQIAQLEEQRRIDLQNAQMANAQYYATLKSQMSALVLNNAGGQLQNALRQTFVGQYEEGSKEAQTAQGLVDRTGALATATTTTGQTVETRVVVSAAMASGEMSLDTIEALVKAAESEDPKQIDYVANFDAVMTQQGADFTGKFAAMLEGAGYTTKEIQMAFKIMADAEIGPQAKALLDRFEASGDALSSAMVLDLMVKGDTAKLTDLQADLTALDAVFANGPVEATVVNEFIAKYVTDAAQWSPEQAAYYNSLPPGDQKMFTDSYLTVVDFIDLNTTAGREKMRQWAMGQLGSKAAVSAKYGSTGGSTFMKDGKMTEFKWDYGAMLRDYGFQQAQNYQQTVAAQRPTGPTGPTGPKNFGGGGGGGAAPAEPEKPPTSFLDSVVKDMRDFTRATQGLTENFADSMAAIRNASVSAFSGLSQQLRSVGVDQNVIEMMTGMSKEDWDQYKGQFFNFDGAGNITSFKNDLGIISEKLRAITLGKFVDEQQKSLTALAQQNAAITKLVGLGMTYADSYKLVEDAAVAAAIANAKSAEEIRKIIDLAKQLNTKQTIFEAAQSLSDNIKNTATSFERLSAIQGFAGNLTNAQISAVMANEQLQVMLDNFDQLDTTQLDTLKKAFEDIERRAEVELKLKMLTPEGMQEIFNDGLSKAMEQFSAREQKIKIDFQLLRNPFEDIVNTFTDQIEDLRNASGGLDDLEADLQRIAEKEFDINEKYKKRFEALDQIQKINDRIAAQQRTQLTLADALSQGDIAAAARAAQEIRAQDAAQALVDQREALQKSQELELESLRGQMNLSREQLEARIRDIKIQIFEIEESQIEPAQRQLEILKRQEESQINALTVLGKTKEDWEAIKNSIDLARTNTDAYIESISLAESIADKLIEDWKEIEKPKRTIYEIIEKRVEDIKAATPPPTTTPVVTPTNPAPTGPVKDQAWVDNMARRVIRGEFGNGAERVRRLGADYQLIQDRVNAHYYRGARLFAKGGLVANYMANGGLTKPVFGPKGTDTVPAMLTPGEFVVKKWAVERFGVGNLQAINQGNFGSGSVYNYNMSVNVRSDANPDEIARTVMAQIKRVDSQRIRGNRF